MFINKKGQEPDEKKAAHPMDRTANWCSHNWCNWFTLAIGMGYNGNVRLQQQPMGMMGGTCVEVGKRQISNKIIKTK
jgi:hypothetical protein